MTVGLGKETSIDHDGVTIFQEYVQFLIKTAQNVVFVLTSQFRKPFEPMTLSN